ncbi:LPS export ABC transporter permease LptG [Acetobacter suratthaniensis]|uniref:LPS export ABC transporter permease LptG n=1 Tax=Acetobacter suratthaniensis TaxID=1502841 RepID=A0ABS3LJP8_9PROT|nr:LPS export ABC transporter permease LptG [Acetobacter suratthaniensis]MBO1327267.1 LPS export ABC transporter permease LptG [Acetobacter suratthaniensis]MCX2565121.1 LPS export ABC transporter permease LptG [Acetobacter suratthaniensis]
MTVAFTLSRYIAKQFVLSVLVMLASLTGMVCLFDFLDLLRRASAHPNAGPSVAAEIAGLHLPYFTILILPFATLLGGVFCFWRLTRSSELVVARAAGISVWQFLMAPLTSAILIGVFATTVVSPLSSIMYSWAEKLDQRYLRSDDGPLSISGGSLWLRQADQTTPHGIAILHARTVRFHNTALQIGNISVLRLNKNNDLISRIEAHSGYLDHGFWILDQASQTLPNELPSAVGRIVLPTDLTVNRVQESFASPDTLSVWALPSFIVLLDRSGFSSIRHRIHFQSLLALPVLSGTMCLVAAGFSMRPSRHGGVARMIGSGVAAGFLLFTVSKVAEQFGKSGVLPPVLAAWVPAVAGLCLAITLLLHLEDG